MKLALKKAKFAAKIQNWRHKKAKLAPKKAKLASKPAIGGLYMAKMS